MANSDVYTILPEDCNSSSASPTYSIADLYEVFRNVDEPKRKKKKKGGKSKKKKKREKAYARLLKASKMGKKDKKGKKKSKKSSKRRAEDFKYRILENAANETLSTTSYALKRYFDIKMSVTK